jgi:serralysin
MASADAARTRIDGLPPRGKTMTDFARATTDVPQAEGDWPVGGAEGPTRLNRSVDGQGGQIRDKPVFTAEEAAAQLNRGLAGWAGVDLSPEPFNARPGSSDGTLSFGFFDRRSDLFDGYVNFAEGYALDEYFGFSALSSAQRDAAREAIGYWDDVIAVDFVEKPNAQADINFGNTTTGPAQAWAYLPYNYFAPHARVAGDVWINPTQASNLLLDESFYGQSTIVHELGHALGLDHPGDYNFGENFSATYENGAEYYQDSYQYTIMSYWDGFETGAQLIDWSIASFAYNSTPAVHDILAAQKIYGAEMTTRTGDTVYGFNSTAGRDAFDFVKTPAPVVSIWDAGGHDTLDLSGYKTNSVIDLNPGAFSSAGGVADFLTLEQINANRAAIGLAPRSQATYDFYKSEWGDQGTLMKDNISIAYGVTIEDAVGGSGADLITGNAVANKLSGNAGADTIFGGAGNDTLIGGDGVDRLTGGTGADVFVGELNATLTATKQGAMSVDIIVDFTSGQDKIDLAAIDAILGGSDDKFTFVGSRSGSSAGQLSFKTFGSVEAAEAVLGIELDGLADSSAARHTTVVFGNIDADKDAEFALVLFDVKGVVESDFWV